MKDHITKGKCRFSDDEEWRPLKIMIDPEDYDRVSEQSWHFHHGQRLLRSRKLSTFLHKFILGITDKSRTAYHIDGNIWNNRKSNLQECSPGEAVSHTREVNKIHTVMLMNMNIKKPVTFL